MNKMEILKRDKFKDEGRSERIAKSLTALNAPQPTEFTPAELKVILEEDE